MHTSSIRKVGWNGLQLDVPSSWEVIVSDKKHLLFERDLEPVLELKWQNLPPKKQDKQIQRIQQGLQNEFGDQSSINNKGKWKKLFNTFNVTPCSWKEHSNVFILLLDCPACNTVLLCRFLSFSKQSEQEIVSAIQSIVCHHEEEKELWSVLDFSIQLPTKLKLKTYSVAAGFTRISFEEKGQDIHICRLAPASHRLQSESMENILTTLVSREKYKATIINEDNYVESFTDPSIFSQIMRRLKREKPFQYGRLWHIEESNRLLGLSVESIRPIPSELVKEIYSSYEIL